MRPAGLGAPRRLLFGTGSDDLDLGEDQPHGGDVASLAGDGASERAGPAGPMMLVTQDRDWFKRLARVVNELRWVSESLRKASAFLLSRGRFDRQGKYGGDVGHQRTRQGTSY